MGKAVYTRTGGTERPFFKHMFEAPSCNCTTSLKQLQYSKIPCSKWHWSTQANLRSKPGCGEASTRWLLLIDHGSELGTRELLDFSYPWSCQLEHASPQALYFPILWLYSIRATLVPCLFWLGISCLLLKNDYSRRGFRSHTSFTS